MTSVFQDIFPVKLGEVKKIWIFVGFFLQQAVVIHCHKVLDEHMCTFLVLKGRIIGIP